MLTGLLADGALGKPAIMAYPVGALARVSTFLPGGPYGSECLVMPYRAPYEKLKTFMDAMYDVYEFDPLIIINMFHLQSSETLKNLSPQLMTEIKDLSRKSLGSIAKIFQDGVDQGLFIDSHPTALADTFWSLFSGVVLWLTSKRLINQEKDYLKETLELAFEVFGRGIKKD